MEAALPDQAADRLGYVPNQRVRSLSAGRTECVGVVVPEPGSDFFLDRQMARLLRGINEELSTNGIQMVLFAPQSPADVQRLEQYLVGGHVDAVLLLTFHESDAPPSRLQARGLPTVVGGPPRRAGPGRLLDGAHPRGGAPAPRPPDEAG